MRGSAAWKERLRKRALGKVERLRHGLLDQSRASVTRAHMQDIISAEWGAMELGGDELDDATLSGDLPPLSHQEFEDLMIAMYEELRKSEGKSPLKFFFLIWFRC